MYRPSNLETSWNEKNNCKCYNKILNILLIKLKFTIFLHLSLITFIQTSLYLNFYKF